MKIKQLKIQIITLLLCGVIFLICACSPGSAELSFEAMDTYMSVKVNGSNAGNIVNDIKTEIERIDRLLSTTDKNSAVYSLNKSAETREKELVDLSRDTLELCKSTGGALDVSVYPLVEEWGFISRDYKIPDDARVKALLENVGCDKIAASGGEIKIPQGMRLDFGAVAKGYAADRVEKILSGNNSSSAIVNFGGTVLAHGRKPDDSLWKVGIANPGNSSDYVGYISCEDKIVATSGNYERFFIGDDGVRYCHIIDPETGRPVQNGVASVTVISDSGLKCDALSTALFVMGMDKAQSYWKENGGFDYILLTEDGKACVTSGVLGSFTLVGSAKYEIEEVK